MASHEDMVGRVETTFAVIYRWRIHADKVDQFRSAWHMITESMRSQRGSYGSRLHRDDDGIYVAIALWPSRAAWEATTPTLSGEQNLTALLRDSISESFPRQCLTVLDDLWADRA